MYDTNSIKASTKPSEGTLVSGEPVDSGVQSPVVNVKACWMSGLSRKDQKDLLTDRSLQ
jgi:hypothetical protein